MTSKLKAQFDAIELYEYVKPMFNILDEIIEYAVEELDEEVSSIDIVDYITDCFQSYLEDTGELNEDKGYSHDFNPSQEEIYETLTNMGCKKRDFHQIFKKTIETSSDPNSLSLEDWKHAGEKFLNNQEEFLGDDYISEEEILKESFRRRAGL